MTSIYQIVGIVFPNHFFYYSNFLFCFFEVLFLVYDYSAFNSLGFAGTFRKIKRWFSKQQRWVLDDGSVFDPVDNDEEDPLTQ